jgi:hypothetical protein
MFRAMNAIRPGHLYELEQFERDLPELRQLIQFIEKEPVSPGSSELRTVRDGTTNEEVLRMLIDRISWLQARCACDENFQVLSCLNNALKLLEQRTADRLRRKVEGRQLE